MSHSGASTFKERTYSERIDTGEPDQRQIIHLKNADEPKQRGVIQCLLRQADGVYEFVYIVGTNIPPAGAKFRCDIHEAGYINSAGQHYGGTFANKIELVDRWPSDAEQQLGDQRRIYQGINRTGQRRIPLLVLPPPPDTEVECGKPFDCKTVFGTQAAAWGKVVGFRAGHISDPFPVEVTIQLFNGATIKQELYDLHMMGDSIFPHLGDLVINNVVSTPRPAQVFANFPAAEVPSGETRHSWFRSALGGALAKVGLRA